MHGGIQSLEIIFLLLMLFVAGFTSLARKLQTTYPIVLLVTIIEPCSGNPPQELDLTELRYRTAA